MFKDFLKTLFEKRSEYQKGYDSAVKRIHEVGAVIARAEYEECHWDEEYDMGYNSALLDYENQDEEPTTREPRKS